MSTKVTLRPNECDFCHVPPGPTGPLVHIPAAPVSRGALRMGAGEPGLLPGACAARTADAS